MRISLKDLGSGGIVTDRPDHELPINVWSDGNNVVFRDGYAQKIKGDSEVYDSPGIRPQWAFNYKDPYDSSEYWIYMGWDDSDNARIYSVTGTTHASITRTVADTITGISAHATTPTVTTTSNHNLVTGDTVTISGVSTGTFTGGFSVINTTHVVTVTGAKTFTVPGVECTSPASDGSVTIDSLYSFTPKGNAIFTDMPVFTTTVLNGLPIINCSTDIPQKWDRSSGQLKGNLENLANWDTDWKCKSLRAFKGFLFAMDINDAGATPTRNPYRVAWSDVIGSQFSEPTAWTAAANNLAGDTLLTDTDGYVQDAIELRGNLLIFKEDATYICSYVGGNTVFVFRLLFNKHGLLAPNCAAKVKGERIFFVTKGDIMITDGNTAESIADSRVREKIFSEIDSTYYQAGGAYCVEHYAEEEIWFCYSTSTDPAANRAAIWNYETGAWSFRSLSNAPCVAAGFIEESGMTWAGLTGSWAAQTWVWGESIQSPGTDSLLICQRASAPETSPTTDLTATAKFLRADDSNQFDGTNMTSYLTRTGLDIVGDGIPQQSPPLVKFVSRIYPKINGGPVDIKVGMSMNEAGPYTYTDPVTYTPENGDYKIDLRQTGRYLALDIRSAGDVGWELNSLDLEMEVTSNGR